MSRYYRGYRRKRYYGYRKKQYDNTDIGDIFFEILFTSIAFIARSIYKGFVLLFQKHPQNSFELTRVQPNPAPHPPSVGVQSSIEKKQKTTQSNEEGRYNLNKSLVTEAEQEFLKVLEEVVGDSYRIVPQVPLSGIVKPKDSNSHYTNYHDFNKISAKKIDFVLYNKETWAPVLAIELDDRSHLKWKRTQRDMFVNELMEGVGLSILHIRTSYVYDHKELRQEILEKTEI